MSYGGHPYGGVAYAASDVADIPQDDAEPILTVEVAFTTGALEDPVWVNVTSDVRSWDVTRGRTRELERMQPGRATVVLGNLSRQYDSAYAPGPHFGNLKPMRRIRIRETFNGTTFPTFDGFIDGWHLDYPGIGHDATATVVATDGFKILARTDLPRSVYYDTVEADVPPIWWRLGDNLDKLQVGAALNQGTGGTTYDAPFVGSPALGAQSLIVNDDDEAMDIRAAGSAAGTPMMGLSVPTATLNLLVDEPVFSIEAWIRVVIPSSASGIYVQNLATVSRATEASTHMDLFWSADLDTALNGRMVFRIDEFGTGNVYAVTTPAASVQPSEIHHVVAVVEADGQMAIWLDGTRYTTALAGATGTDVTGVAFGTGDFNVGFDGNSSLNANRNWSGTIDEFAVWFRDLGATRIAAHHEAGTHPWQDDQPGERAVRILDLSDWPASLRELDDGNVALQSATLGETALEHAQKVAETEFGLLLMSRAGEVRLVERAALFARVSQATFGDDGAEIGYRAVTFNDGDEVIRNRATISRRNGVAKTDEDTASVDEFGRFDYVLDGLLHRLDSYSQNYADFIAAEYAEPRRRVTSLMLGPAAADKAAVLYPQMLGREMGEMITVKNRPPGGGAAFSQDCAIEGIHHAGTPKVRTATWILSPDFTGSLL